MRLINTPLSPLIPNDSASAGVRGWMPTPSHPRRMVPVLASSRSISRTVLMGIANPIPWPPLIIAVLIPTTSPWVLSSGPPEFPGLMDASVWIRSPVGSAPGRSTRPVALITPRVTVLSSPKGFPTAIAHSPTLIFVESPSTATGSLRDGLILRRATSVRGSAPTTFARYSVRSESRMTISSASRMTCSFVTISPSSLTMTPDPREFSRTHPSSLSSSAR